jgi:hypothetical protein
MFMRRYDFGQGCHRQYSAGTERRGFDRRNYCSFVRCYFRFCGAGKKLGRMRTLFIPEARLIPTGKRPDGTGARRVLSVEDYVKSSGPSLEKNGFFEIEIGRKMEQFGGVVHVFSTYESKRALSDEKPFMRGINSIQLWNDGKRWWIVNIFWQSETAEFPIPEKYLSK